jgi:outer membrane protein assembly factor BamA
MIKIRKTILLMPIYLMLLVACPKVFSEDIFEESNIVRSIEYEYYGPRLNISQDIIESYVFLKEGKEFSSFLADASLKSLYASGKFDHVSIKVDEISDTNDYKVIFSLTPRVQVESIEFMRNKKFKSTVFF